MLVGITGQAGVGKDTLADALIRKHGGVKTSFADPLKAACRELFQLSDAQLHDRSEKEKIDDRWGRSPRQLLQLVGTDLLRNQLDKEIFIKSMRARVKNLLESNPLVVVTDCRFENEAQLVRDLTGRVVHLQREGVRSVSPHISENRLSVQDEDVLLSNDSTVKDLLARCETYLSSRDCMNVGCLSGAP